MFKSKRNLTFIQTDISDSLSQKVMPGNLTLAYNKLKTAEREASAARRAYDQSRSNLDNSRQKLNPTQDYWNELYEQYVSAALQVLASSRPLYSAMKAMDDVLREVSPTLEGTDFYCNDYDGWWGRKLVRNNLVCAIELQKQAFETYSRIPEPSLQGTYVDHLQKCCTTAQEELNSWPPLPQRWGDQNSRNMADFLVRCLTATLARPDRHADECQPVQTGDVSDGVVEEVAKLLRAAGWQVRRPRTGLKRDVRLARKCNK
jgi:hypothetical protein